MDIKKQDSLEWSLDWYWWEHDCLDIADDFIELAFVMPRPTPVNASEYAGTFKRLGRRLRKLLPAHWDMHVVGSNALLFALFTLAIGDFVMIAWVSNHPSG
ncbi:MAG: hypothetical protein ACOH18_04700 [Candidatus Saccharimonadaceae bacterium]